MNHFEWVMIINKARMPNLKKFKIQIQKDCLW